MQIITGLEYSYKWKQTIQKCIDDASNNPFTTYYIIVKDPTYIEEAFLQYTDALFNIEIMTFHGLLRKFQTTNKEVVSSTEKVLLLKSILEENKDSMLYRSNTIFSTINQLLPIFDTFYYANKDNMDVSSLNILSREKMSACYHLYKQFMERIPAHKVYHNLENVHSTCQNQYFYFMDDCIWQPRELSFIETLDKDNTVFVIASYEKGDSRIVSASYQQYFSNYSQDEVSTEDSFHHFLCSQIFSNTPNEYSSKHPYICLKETNPIEEIKSVCFHIYQQIVENNMSYQDFVIYYPNVQYLDILQDTLSKFNIPFNVTPTSNDYPIVCTCVSLLQWIQTNEEEDFLKMLDSLLLKKCSSFKQVNYYKKTYAETSIIQQVEYEALKLYVKETYRIPFTNATSIRDKSEIILSFLQEEIVYDDTLRTIQGFFSSLSEYEDTISSKDYMDLIRMIKPMQKGLETTFLDHVYIANLQQTSLAVLPIKRMYILGLNETIVPSAIKDEGILLDKEKVALGLRPTIRDTLSLQQNHFLQILTSAAKEVVFSYSMASTTNETLLPSSYLLHLQKIFNIPSIDTSSFYQHPVNKHRLYMSNGRDITCESLNQTIDVYQQRKNQPENLTMLPYHTTMSASQLETYNGCPYKYFCQYGLELQPFRSSQLQSNEIGTLVHYILESSTPFFKNREQTRNIDIVKIKQHIEETITKYLQEHPEIQLKMKETTNQFFISCIKEDMFNTILILIQQMHVSTFHVENTEERLQTQYYTIDMKGFVDRVDRYLDYIKVIDYKSSDKDLDLSLAMQGFNIQMLLYMDILANEKQLHKGAVLYFNTKKRILKSSLSILEEELPDNFFKEYRMNGYVVEDVVEDIDGQIDGASKIIKVRHIKKDDSYKGNVLTQDALSNLLQEVGKHITYLYQQILSGTISITPKGSNDPAIHAKVNPCTYCPYRSICNLDIFYNTPALVKNLDVQTILGGEDNVH